MQTEAKVFKKDFFDFNKSSVKPFISVLANNMDFKQLNPAFFIFRKVNMAAGAGAV